MPLPLLPPVDCALVEVHESSVPALPSIAAPPGFGATATTTGTTGGPKAWYGTPAGDTLSSDNFGVVWQPGDATEVEAQAALDALESTWSAAVDGAGWLQPWSSHDFLIWVVLDPYLGVQGRTDEVASEDFAEGVPVITLDPAVHGADPDRFAVVAAHQLHHALQYRVRGELDPDEAWFWEASAAWGAVLALPTNAARYDDVVGFADAPETPRSEWTAAHGRGLLVLPAWLDEQGVGPGATHAVWEDARQHPDLSLGELAAEAAGLELPGLWAAFSAATANQTLSDGSAIPALALEGELIQGVGGDVGELAIHAWEHLGTEPVDVRLSGVATDGAVVLGSPAGVGELVRVEPGEVVTVVGTSPIGHTYQLFTEPVADDSGDGARPAGRADPTVDSVVHGSCACATGQPALGSWLALGLLAVLRRRSPPT